MGFAVAEVKGTLYLKGEQCVEVKTRDVTLGDLCTMACAYPNVVLHLKNLKILKIPKDGKQRYVISILKIIECIHGEFPKLEIQILGPPDVIVTYEQLQKSNRLWQACKIIFIALTTFLGSAFAIMTFNHDSGIPELFDKIYEQLTGIEKTGFSVLEFTYSLGIILGVLVFFNHFGKRKFSVDPTPMEVEMRLYENDIQTTIIAENSRKGQEIDVGQSDSTGNHRT